MWVEKRHPAISSPLSLHNSSVGSSEKGTLKRKLRGTSIMEKNSSSYMILYFIRLVGNLYMLYFCVYNDFLSTEADCQGLSCWRYVTLQIHPPGVGTPKLAADTHPWNPPTALLPWLGRCGTVLLTALVACHYTINFTAFLIPNAAFLSSCAGWDGLLHNREPNCCH